MPLNFSGHSREDGLRETLRTSHGIPGKAPGRQGAALIDEAARECRSWAVTMTSAAGSGHPAGSLSSMEMYLMVYGAANITPENFHGLERDFVVVSHGHTSPGAYSVLADTVLCLPKMPWPTFTGGKHLPGARRKGGPGIDWGSGNLGQGSSAGVGSALAIWAREKEGSRLRPDE